MNQVTIRQHYLPCCYLKFFSAKPEFGRDAPIFRFDGKSSISTKVMNEGVEKWTYSRKQSKEAENFFQINFENGYSPIAQAIIDGRKLRGKQKFNLFIFALVTKFRSPSYKITTDEERFDAVDGIWGSAVDTVTPIRDDDRLPGNEWNHFRRLYSMFSLKIIDLPKDVFISEDPCQIYKMGGQFMAALVLPITPNKFAVFYQKKLIACENTVTQQDFIHLGVLQRQSRRRFLYYPTDLSHLCRPDQEMEPPAKNLSEISKGGKVVHHYLVADDLFDFLKLHPSLN